MAADLEWTRERVTVAQAVAADAQECVAAEAALLKPVLTASGRFSTTTVSMSDAVLADAAHRATTAVVSEVGPRTDAVISASGMAPADVVAGLRAARDAVLGGEGDGTGLGALLRWLAAASEVESTHATVNAAAIAAVERAAADAAAAAEEQASAGVWVGPGSVDKSIFVQQTPEEFLAQCIVSPFCNPYGTVGEVPDGAE